MNHRPNIRTASIDSLYATQRLAIQERGATGCQAALLGLYALAGLFLGGFWAWVLTIIW